MAEERKTAKSVEALRENLDAKIPEIMLFPETPLSAKKSLLNAN